MIARHNSLKDSEQLITKIVSLLEEYANLIDAPQQSAVNSGLSDLQSGLGMVGYAKNLRDKAVKIRSGIYQVMNMGVFNTGKSTLLNSLVGSDRLPRGVLACTAIITLIKYGKNNDSVLVNYMDKNESEIISIKDFTERYKLTPEDEDEAIKTNQISRFQSIKNAVFECDYPLCKSGILLVDTPGLEDRETCTKKTQEYVHQVDAIIYMLNATVLLHKADRDYIKDNFYDRQMNNIFIIINRIDNLNDQQELDEVKGSTRNFLKRVFTDKNGAFDEDLYNKRVFYVSALKALKAKENNDDAEFETSGVGAFEKEFEIFLTSREKLAGTYQLALTDLSSIYQLAEQIVYSKIRALESPLVDLQIQHDESKLILDDLLLKIEGLKRTIDVTSTVIESKLQVNLTSFVNDLEQRWPQECKKIEVEYGLGGLLSTAWEVGFKKMFSSEAEKQRALQEKTKPLVEAVRQHIEKEFKNWVTQFKIVIEKNISDLNKEIGQTNNQIDIGLHEAMQKFTPTGPIDGDGMREGSTIQLLISALNQDFSLMAENLATGKKNWNEFIGKTILQSVIGTVAFITIGGLPGIALFLGAEIIQSMMGASSAKDKFLLKIGMNYIQEIKKNINISEATKTVHSKFVDWSKELTEPLYQQVKDEEDRQVSIINNKKNTEFDLQKEQNRMQAVLNRMHEIINGIHHDVYGTELTKSDIGKYSIKQNG